jgi:hypothetical protein
LTTTTIPDFPALYTSPTLYITAEEPNNINYGSEALSDTTPPINMTQSSASAQLGEVNVSFMVTTEDQPNCAENNESMLIDETSLIDEVK